MVKQQQQAIDARLNEAFKSYIADRIEELTMEKYDTVAQALDEIANDFGNDPSEILYEAVQYVNTFGGFSVDTNRNRKRFAQVLKNTALEAYGAAAIGFGGKTPKQKYNLRGITKQTVLKGKKLTEYRKVLRQAIDNYISYLEGKSGGINVFSVETNLPKKMLRAPIKHIQTALDQHGGTAIGHILLNDQKEFAKRVLKARLNKVDTKKK